MSEPPDLPLACLTSVEKKMSALKGVTGEQAAIVRVEMSFSSPQAAPQVTVRFNSGDASYAQTILDRVADYRLPCLESGRSVDLMQEFQFVPDKRTGLQLQPLNARYAQEDFPGEAKCRVDGLGESLPHYPGNAAHQVNPGKVVVNLRFADRYQAPRPDVSYDSSEPWFVQGVLETVSKYRLRCAEPLRDPLVTRQVFSYQRDGFRPARLLPALGLQQLLSIVEGLDTQKVRFDFKTMACPFKVAFEPFEPYDQNSVKADLRSHPERREFVRWLRKIVLKIPDATMRTAIGETSTITVPCVVIDLT